MNEAAEEAGVVVLYPEQAVAANALRCWNCVRAAGARSNKDGDAALIASMTRQVVREHDIDATRVYVAGMSAGGGMAAVLARDYPDLYAAIGIHSGVPAGLAHDVFSALRLMSQGPQAGENAGEADADPVLVVANGNRNGRAVASIVFHGDEDTTVHLSNGKAIHAASGSSEARSTTPRRRFPWACRRWPLRPTLASAASRAQSSSVRAGRHLGSCGWFTAPATHGQVAATRKGTSIPAAPTHRARCCAFSCSIG